MIAVLYNIRKEYANEKRGQNIDFFLFFTLHLLVQILTTRLYSSVSRTFFFECPFWLQEISTDPHILFYSQCRVFGLSPLRPPPSGATVPSGPGPLHYRGFTFTLRHITLDTTPLDEWTARRRDLYLTTTSTICRVEVFPKFKIHTWELISDSYQYIPVAYITTHCIIWP